MLRILFSLLLPIASFSQDTSSLEEVIVYSSKFAERQRNLAQKIEVISSKRISEINAQNTGDLLTATGNVFVQKSQQGGGSPVIRGFEASRVLLVIDGIRMNNTIYRAGHLQNLITVDQSMLASIEVLYGPGSTLYGSDALGGVIIMRTLSPRLVDSSRKSFQGSAFTRYGTVNNEKTIHAHANLGGKKWAWLQSYTYSDFGDLRMGGNSMDAYPNFGRRPYYIQPAPGNDQYLRNEDELLQKFSGYSQWDITQKFLFKPRNNTSHLLNLQYSSSSNVPRYDRLQDIRNDSLRYAEWYYGPQTRILAAYEINHSGWNLFPELRSSISFQKIKESRHQRDRRRYNALDNRLEDLSIASLNIDGRRKWKSHELITGLDAQLNFLSSDAYRQNVITGARSPLDTRYPDGENYMHYAGLYAQHIYKGKGWVLNDGFRIQFVTQYSSIDDTTVFQLPFKEFSSSHLAFTGNLGAVFFNSPSWRTHISISSGFRSPNIDDLSRIFESSSADQRLVVPNPGLKPEYTLTVDGGFSFNKSRFRISATGFYSLFRNAISLAPFLFNNQDSIFYDGAMSAVFANRNVAKAYITGLNLDFGLKLFERLFLDARVNYTYGRYQTDNSKSSNIFIRRANGTHVDTVLALSSTPLDHVPPIHGRVGLRYLSPKLQFEAYSIFNGWKRITDMSTSGEDNPQYALPAGYRPQVFAPDGYPSWATINLKGSYNLTNQFTIQAGVENIFDLAYRPFASGLSGGGRNFFLTLRTSF